MPTPSTEHLSIAPRNVRPIPADMLSASDSSADLLANASLVGVGLGRGVIQDMAQALGFGMDSVQSPVTTSAIAGYIQFLQQWMPGFVNVITAARKIDELVGVQTIGSWEDEQIVQQQLENTGYAIPYGDYTNVPFSDWNMTTVPREVVRMEMGMRVGNLEEARAARVRVNSPETKRQSCGIALEVARNLIGFNGYNAGANNTYGFLNDPGLPAYVTVANGTASSPLWVNKTFLEICKDIRTGMAQLQNQSQDNINPEDIAITMALATNAYQYLSVVSDFGISVRDWLKTTYPKLRIVSAPQLNTANGGVGVFYLYAESISDGLSTDGGSVFVQMVPAKFMVLGVAKLAKGYEEDYSNATAGVMLKRPWAVVRYSGIS